MTKAGGLRADRFKILAWDGSGLVLFWKRLEQGAFRWPPISDGVMRLSVSQLAALVDGMDWSRLHATDVPRPTATAGETVANGISAVIALSRAGANLIQGHMGARADQLPTDITALQAQLAAARAERDAAIAERDQALSQIDHLRHLLHQLQPAQFDRRSEKLDADQLQLALENAEQAIAADESEDDKKDPAAARARADKRRADRGALPAHLPRVHVTIAPDDTNCPCMILRTRQMLMRQRSQAGN